VNDLQAEIKVCVPKGVTSQGHSLAFGLRVAGVKCRVSSEWQPAKAGRNKDVSETRQELGLMRSAFGNSNTNSVFRAAAETEQFPSTKRRGKKTTGGRRRPIRIMGNSLTHDDMD
jgi:hypothetical protein